ncbi:hypothetical protein [Photobacterium sp. R1]
MSLEIYQVNFDLSLKDVEYKNILLVKVEDKINELISAGYDNNVLIFRAEYFCKIIKEEIISIERYIRRTVEKHKGINPYEYYQQDLEENIDILEFRSGVYKKEFEKCPLITDKNGEILDPKDWYLDTKNATFPKCFVPKVTKTITQHKEVDGVIPTTVASFEKKWDYSLTQFYYADDETIIKDRFILYWQLDDDYGLNSAGYNTSRLNTAYINSNGEATKISAESSFLVTEETSESDCFILKKLMHPKHLLKEKDRYYYNLTESRINLSNRTAFILYPLDQTVFKTKPLHELSKIKAPSYVNDKNLQDRKVIFEGESERAPARIYLHCTLPEWNHRLRKVLGELQMQINEYNLICAPHYSKLNALSDMEDLLELHQRFGTNYDPKNKKIEKELISSINKLSSAIRTAIECPEDKHPTFEYYTQKKHIDLKAEELFYLIKSPALYAELKSYIESSADEESSEVKMHTGPYMEEEYGWHAIFETIAECYAALSHSEIYGDKIWNEDINFGIEVLANFSGDKSYKEICDLWFGVLNASYVENDEDIPEYLSSQYESLNEFEPDNSNNHDSIFSLIVSNYESLLKPYLGHVVPGPGAPCTLQVVLSCYQPFIFNKIKQALTNDATYHIRLLRSVLCVFNVLNPRDGKTKLANGLMTVTDFFKAFVVTRSIKRSNLRASDTLREIKVFIEKANESEGNSKAFYDAINQKKPVATAVGKSIYTMFNLTLSIQSLQALSEKAKLEGWPSERIYLEYLNGYLDITNAVGSFSGSTSMAIAAVIERAKFSAYTGGLGKNLLKFGKNISALLDKLAIPLGIVQTVVSLYYVAEHLENGEYKEAVLAAGSAASGLLLVSGFILRTGVLIPVAAILGPVLGTILIIVGTIVSVLLLAIEIAELSWNLLSTNSQSLLEEYWVKFQSKLPMLKVDVLRKYELLPVSIDMNNGNIVSMRANELYDTEYDIIKIYNSNPYEMYKLYGLTKDLINIVDDLHVKEIIFDEGVNLGDLRWQAVIPLYINNKYDIEEIRNLVDFEINDFDGINKIDKLIEYYESVKSNEEIDQLLYIDDNGNVFNTKISTLLEVGAFNPKNYEDFYGSELWSHKYFFREIDIVAKKRNVIFDI